MASRRQLAQRLAAVDGFDDPSVELEQYVTPPTIAASLVHSADLRGDLDRPVIDLGCGTGMLAIAAATRADGAVLGLDIDRSALELAVSNARTVGVDVKWIQGDSRTAPICPPGPVTVVMNPPFGAQLGRRGADRPFLACAAEIASVSYSIHNADSRRFVESYAADLGGTVTDAFAVDLDIPAQFAFHEQAVGTVDAEAYRIEWRA